MTKESFESLLVVACVFAALAAICFWVNSCSVTERHTKDVEACWRLGGNWYGETCHPKP